MYPKIEKTTHNFDGMKKFSGRKKKTKNTLALTSIKKIIMCAEILVFF